MPCFSYTVLPGHMKSGYNSACMCSRWPEIGGKVKEGYKQLCVEGQVWAYPYTAGNSIRPSPISRGQSIPSCKLYIIGARADVM